MGFFNVLGHMFDFRVDRWLDLKRLENNTNFLIEVTKSLATSSERKKNQETFEEAKERLEWSTELIETQIKHFTWCIRIFTLITVLLLGYSFYTYFFGTFFNSILILGLSFFSTTMVFRYHFWRYQLQKQQLGCSLKEWFNHCMGKDL
jgi:intracellular multiplication protein IcmV